MTTCFLSTVQIGITWVGILAGVEGGATIAEQLDVLLSRFSLLASHGEVIVVLAIAYLSLVIGELVPKRLALAKMDILVSSALAAAIGSALIVVTSPRPADTFRLSGPSDGASP